VCVCNNSRSILWLSENNKLCLHFYSSLLDAKSIFSFSNDTQPCAFFFVVFCFFQELNIIIVCGNNNGGFFYQTTTLFDNTLGISNIVRKIFVSISFEDILSNNQILIYESISFFSPRLMLTVSRVRYSQAWFSVFSPFPLTSSTLLIYKFPYSLTSWRVQPMVSLLQVVIGYVANAKINIFHKKFCNAHTVQWGPND